MEKPYKIEFMVTYVDMTSQEFMFSYPTKAIRDDQYEAIYELCKKGMDKNRILDYRIIRSTD